MSVTSPSCHLCFWPTSYRLGFPTPSSLSLVNFLDWLIELSKVRTLLTRFLVYYERIALGNSQMEAIHRASTGKGTEWGCSASMSLQSMPRPQISMYSPPWRASEILLLDFYGNFITWAQLMKLLTVGDRFNVQSLYRPWKFQPSNHIVPTSPHL